jgi:hypothetical protein
MVSRLAKDKWNLRTRNRRSSRERSMSRPSQNRFVIGSVALLYFLISVSSFAQNAGDSGAHYRDLAASNRSLAADYRGDPVKFENSDPAVHYLSIALSIRA